MTCAARLLHQSSDRTQGHTLTSLHKTVISHCVDDAWGCVKGSSMSKGLHWAYHCSTQGRKAVIAANCKRAGHGE